MFGQPWAIALFVPRCVQCAVFMDTKLSVPLSQRHHLGGGGRGGAIAPLVQVYSSFINECKPTTRSGQARVSIKALQGHYLGLHNLWGEVICHLGYSISQQSFTRHLGATTLSKDSTKARLK